MKTSKHRAISSSFHTISCDKSGLGKTKTGPGHRQFNLYHSLWYEWSGQNQNKMTWPREDWANFFFLFLAFRGGHAVKRRGKQNTIYNKFQERNHWPNYFCISVWQIEFWTDMSSPSSQPAMFCTYTHFSCSFILEIRSASGGIYKRHLVEGSDRRYVDEMVLFLPSYLKFTHERDSNCFVSGLVLRELQRKQFKQL